MGKDIFPERTYPSSGGSIGDWYAIIRAEVACKLMSHGIDRATCMLISRGKMGRTFKLTWQDYKNWCVTRNNVNDAVKKLESKKLIQVIRKGSHKREFRVESVIYTRKK